MTTPGMTVHPLPLMNGWADPNEVFLDNVVVPAENLVHVRVRAGRWPSTCSATSG